MAIGDDMNVAAELAKLRGEMSTGFEQIKGQLNLIAQSQGQVREDIEELSGEVSALEKRVTALEERRWPVGQVAALSGVIGTLAAAAALVVK